MKNEGIYPNMLFPTTNDIHDEALIEHFRAGMGHKLLAITPSFPFFFIGKIRDVVEDHVVVDVETVPNQELENRRWYIHVHNIELFFIEREEGPKIPELNDEIF
ncbi:hypothetical protein [Salirhabdus sp. Marseille-P4669]|uniref:hypothetical protein n=1 Tax=Salirhabdus sp. Marseille-P4669 TaxID=2042310 RepID=UPI001F3139F4|nr:hypothetical protein [Salirhabdus sp. Marseille-P4669]